ncbi:hypothetical protein GUY44_07535 [Pimelobacter simplex]|uniref:Uncharacterized protein n=1 Tax=Nocardioides simplex TaxID=2045 RepID=A0A0J9YH40_NOCSI|nr:hypothetical protein [Pimelobacter simplex]AIY15821.1 hypothetical protein KR76_01835 [Pimelobacter simplex]MCG8150326.1 hypothetical protein [Pimelobacter simplex]
MKEVLLAALPVAGSLLLALGSWGGRRPLIRSGGEIQRRTLSAELEFVSQFPEGSVERQMLDDHLRVGVSRYLADSFWQTRDQAYMIGFGRLMLGLAMLTAVASWVMSLVLAFARRALHAETVDSLESARNSVMVLSIGAMVYCLLILLVHHRSRKKKPVWSSNLDAQTWERLKSELAPRRSADPRDASASPDTPA